jgi:hypothetical protein
MICLTVASPPVNVPAVACVSVFLAVLLLAAGFIFMCRRKKNVGWMNTFASKFRYTRSGVAPTKGMFYYYVRTGPPGMFTRSRVVSHSGDIPAYRQTFS